MIIDLHITIRKYEKKMSNKENRLYYQCPDCQKKQLFWRHGTYERIIIHWDGKMRERKLIVQRGICTACKHTHSILPYEVLPNRIFHISYLLRLFRLLHVQKKHVTSCCSKMQISYQYLYLLIRKFLCCTEVKKYIKEFQQIKVDHPIRKENQKKYLFYFLCVKILSGDRFTIGFAIDSVFDSATG